MLVTCEDNTLPGSFLDDYGQVHISPHDYDIFHVINYLLLRRVAPLK